MKPRMTWFRRIFGFSAVVLLSLVSSLGTGYAGVAQAAVPNARSCAHANDVAGAGAPKQAALTSLDPATPPTGCPSGLIAFWKLDETSGKTFADSSGNGNDGICTNHCPVPSAAGIISGTQTFLTSTVVTVTAAAPFEFSFTQSFSIEFWMKTDAGSTCAANQVVIARATASNPSLHQWWAGCQDGGKAMFLARDQNGVAAFVTSSAGVADAGWHHVVAVRDAPGNQLRLYVDGAADGSTATTFTAGFDFATPVTLGYAKFGSPYHFHGNIDEVAIYNRVLTSQEISTHHTQGLAGRGICDTVVVPPLNIKLFLPLVLR